MTEIRILKEGSTDINRVASYSLPPKQAMIAYIMQHVFNNYNTWSYPETIEGMRESQTVKDHWYYDLFKGKNGEYNAVISAYPT